MQRIVFGFLALSFLSHCAPNNPEPVRAAVKPRPHPTMELDDVGQPVAGVSLLVLGIGADRDHLVDVIEHRLQGIVYQLQGQRLLSAHVPDGSEAVLASLGVVSQLQRSVDPSEIRGVTLEETRFVRIFDSLYYPGGGPKIVPKRLAVKPGTPFEHAPTVAPPLSARLRAQLKLAQDTITTPYASGTVIVSIILPESNGVAEPSSEDWTEDAILETYQKIQTAVQAYELSEPNANLRYIIHYESSPANGGLPGTVDSDYECGLHFDFTNPDDENRVTAPLLARLVGHPVAQDEISDASYEYLDNLRTQYGADGAFYVKVSANQNGTAGIRAHATINGPWCSLSSDYGFGTFTHEFGHIMGALDEYCPDACISTTAEQGYLGVPDANSFLPFGSDGINYGRGESQESLMASNNPNAINGFTRGAWGWQDSDGDGIIDVRDTIPATDVFAEVTGSQVRLVGTIVDQPEVRWNAQPRRSFNHITALEYQLGHGQDAPWFVIPIVGHFTTANVFAELGAFPGGDYEIRVRGRNSVGNVDGRERLVNFSVGAVSAADLARSNTPPHLRLDLATATGSVRTAFRLTATSTDLDRNDQVSIRFDTDGDGIFETAAGGDRTVTARFAQPGIYTVGAEARDRHGAVTVATAQVFVLDRNAPPTVSLDDLPSVFYGLDELRTALHAHGADADNDALEYNWLVQGATQDNTYAVETGFAPRNRDFQLDLTTPLVLKDLQIDVTAGDRTVQGNNAQQIVAITPTVIATAIDSGGVLFTDITDPLRPALIGHFVTDTGARSLLLDGHRLYVLGGALTIFDVSNPQAPFEIRQGQPVVHTRVDTISDATAIPDLGQGRKGADQQHQLTFAERITSAQVDVEIDHPSPGQLTLTLDIFTNGQLSSVVLQDQVAGPGGRHVYSFTPATTRDLGQLIGSLANGTYDVRVTDNVAGDTGTLLSSTLTFGTSTSSFGVIEGNTRLVGALPGNYVVVAGLGLEVIDARKPSALKQAALLTGTGTFSATMYGQTAIVFSPTTLPPPKGLVAAPAPTPPQTHGLYAVDLSRPAHPVIKRQDDSLGDGGGDVFVVGSYLYINAPGPRGSVAVTQIADPAAFVNNARTYVVGAMPALISPSSFGTDRLLWTLVNGQPQGFDVRNPAKVVTRYSYLRPQHQFLLSLGGDLALIYDSQLTPSEVHLTDGVHLLSRTYRVTVEARDSQGAIGHASRTVQVVPYDHTPSARASLVSGRNAGDTFTFQVDNTDADNATTWDPFLFTRADLDSDGFYETDWLYSAPSTQFQVVLPTSGTYRLRFQTRDTFGAHDEAAVTVRVP